MAAKPRILVINCGSSSIKYKLFGMTDEVECAGGLIERMNEPRATIIHQVGGNLTRLAEAIPDVRHGVRRLLQLVATLGDPPPLSSSRDILAVGHRVVHGGDEFSDSAVVDERVLESIHAYAALAPLHNPANLAGLRASMVHLPGTPQVAVFDTAFFQTIPPAAYHYGLPREWCERFHVRRYGFHGSSHRYVAMIAADLLANPRPNLITIHLGNGSSAACIKAGIAIDHSMGLTPLEGLMMGTRSGDLDPGIIFHLLRHGLDIETIRDGIETSGGMLGISGVSSDLRDVHQAAIAGNDNAALAIDVFIHRVRKYIGAFLVELGTCDAIVFTGGIGENASFIREGIISGLEPLGIRLDAQRNDHQVSGPMRISELSGSTAVWVIPTNEELLIARDTFRLVSPNTA